MKTDDLVALLAADTLGAARAGQQQRRLAIFLLVLAVTIAAAAFFALMGARAGMDVPAVRNAVLRKETVALVAAVFGLGLALRQMNPAAVSSRLWLAPAGVSLVLAVWDIVAFGAAGGLARMVGSNGLFCLMMIPLLSALPMMALLVWLRRGATTTPATTGALAGLGAAGIGASLYALHCTDDSMLFVALWYGLAALIMAGAGALAGRRLLVW